MADKPQTGKRWWNKPIGGSGLLLVLLWLVTGIFGKPFMLRHYESAYQQAAVVELGGDLLPGAGADPRVQAARRFAQAYRDLHNSHFPIAPIYCVTLYVAARQMN